MLTGLNELALPEEEATALGEAIAGLWGSRKIKVSKEAAATGNALLVIGTIYLPRILSLWMKLKAEKELRRRKLIIIAPTAPMEAQPAN